MGFWKRIFDDMLGLAPKAPDPPAPAPAAPTMEDPAIQRAAEERRREEAKKFGRKKTVLTSPLGDTGAAPVSAKTLLGG